MFKGLINDGDNRIISKNSYTNTITNTDNTNKKRNSNSNVYESTQDSIISRIPVYDYLYYLTLST